jgi:hypothetical protein
MTKPHVEAAPGIVWRPMKDGRWEARWYCRSDLIKKGFRPSSMRVWAGVGDLLNADNVNYIQDRAQSLQAEMLAWSHGALKFGRYDGTIKTLAQCYQTDPDSPYHKVRYVSRRYYNVLLEKLIGGHGHELISDIKARHALRWYEEWSKDGKLTMGHSMMGMLRTIINFGMTILEDGECARLSAVLSKMKFKTGKARTERLTAEQATAIRKRAHEKGLHSIALAQAFQFDCILRQKDVLGEWVPLEEPGVSDVLWKQQKWIRGLRWEEIDANMVLNHVTSKRQKMLEIPLAGAPMVMEELQQVERKASGPIIINDSTGRPWHSMWFRRQWRQIANECGVPKEVRNMDSRAGAISEATDAGADLEHIRQAATHSDIAMTQRYSRGDADKTANVLRIRVAHRKKQERP